jgi:hypothetical protein
MTKKTSVLTAGGRRRGLALHPESRNRGGGKGLTCETASFDDDADEVVDEYAGRSDLGVFSEELHHSQRIRWELRQRTHEERHGCRDEDINEHSAGKPDLP